jgi:hypothetical protein
MVGSGDSKNGIASGLRTTRRDADFLTDEPIEQRGLSDIGAAGDGDVAEAKISLRDQREIPGT